MLAFLTSSPFVVRAPRAIVNPENGFLFQLKEALPENPSCLFVASDPDGYERTDYYAEEQRNAFMMAGLPIGELAVLDHRNCQDAQVLVWESDFIILAGGHVPTQNAFFQEIGLAEILKGYQGVVMGISAGTMNAAARVYVQPEKEGESSPDFPRFAHGLGLTKVQVLPHYQQVKDDVLDGLRLFEDITYADSFGECFFALVDGSFLRVENGKTTLFGEAYRIRDGVTEQISALGDVTALEP